MTESIEPIRESKRTQSLHALHHATGQLIALESASKSPRILIDGDIEVSWPDAVQSQITDRIETKMSEIAAAIEDLQGA